MKIIISHDVDHLYAKDHWLRDFVYPKLWIRESLNLIRKNISLYEWILRITDCFRVERNNIEALADFDVRNGIPSTFFFGMNQGLGMSYKPDEAKSKVCLIKSKNLDVGVHGIAYSNFEDIQNEYNKFISTTGIVPNGMRMHYVRYNKDTFSLLEQVGYKYDSTEFDKEEGNTLKNPYKIGAMWEFPVTIMDSYLPKHLGDAKNYTINHLQKCKDSDLKYVSILFHDYYFTSSYSILFNWYKWLIQYILETEGDIFISYENAVKELERENGGR